MSDALPQAPGELHGFDKSRTERIHAALFSYRGEYRIDLRTFYFSRKDGGYRRTKRGVSFPLALLPELEAAVAKLRQAADALPPTSASGGGPPPRGTTGGYGVSGEGAPDASEVPGEPPSDPLAPPQESGSDKGGGS